MTPFRLAATALAVVLVPVVGPAPKAVATPAGAYGQAPPDWGMRGLQTKYEQQGYVDGKRAARIDFDHRRRRAPEDIEDWLAPRLPPEVIDEYREGFVRGYEVGMSQLRGEDQWSLSGDPSQWAPPSAYTDIQRRGFHDGVEGARKDFGNHRRQNVVNRDEYRTPHVDQAYWADYRQGFRRGYEMAAYQLWGGM